MKKEQLARRGVTIGAAMAVALGASACENPFLGPNDITACPGNWGDGSTSTGYPYDLTMSDATARLEAGRTELVSRIHQSVGHNNHSQRSDDIPGKYKAAAGLLIEQTNEYWYDTSQSALDTPREQFCNDTLGNTHLSPAYVQADSALKAAGINILEVKK